MNGIVAYCTNSTVPNIETVSSTIPVPRYQEVGTEPRAFSLLNSITTDDSSELKFILIWVRSWACEHEPCESWLSYSTHNFEAQFHESKPKSFPYPSDHSHAFSRINQQRRGTYSQTKQTSGWYHFAHQKASAPTLCLNLKKGRPEAHTSTDNHHFHQQPKHLKRNDFINPSP